MNRKVVPVAAAVVAIAAITTLTAVKIASPVQCQPDPSAQIAALPAGGTFTGSGCYTVPNGIRITKSVTLDGGTYIDPSNTPPAKGSFKPVIQAYETQGVTLENLAVQGGNPNGGYHGSLVGQSGIELISSSDVVISNVSTSQTLGDGLELWANVPKNKTPNANVTVDGLTVNTAGRDGISPSNVTDSTFTNVSIGATGLVGVNLESDIKGIGAGNVTFANSTWTGTYVQEALTGPVNVTSDTLRGHVVIRTHVPVAYPITFNGGSLAIGHWTIPGVEVQGPTGATFSGMTFTHQPANKYGPMWSATNGANLTFLRCSLIPPLGTNDSTSTVTVIP